jgi:SAM-dependent methyltransferase
VAAREEDIFGHDVAMEPTPESLATDLEQQYVRRFAPALEYRDRVWKILTREYFQRYVASASTVFDLGCGYGQFINNIRAKAKYAMDLNPSSKRMLALDVRFFEQDCSLPWPIATHELDVVFTSNFLEHLPDKAAVRATLDEAARCLKPGGTIICLGPNVRFVPGAYWDFWDHHVALTDRSMSEILELTGFTVEKRIDRFLPYTMAGGREPNIALVRLYVRLSFVWSIFGRQFLIVGRRT